MTFALLHSGEGTALFAGTPVVRAGDVTSLVDATALLGEAERVLADARMRSVTLCEEARSEGFAQGVTRVADEIAQKLATLGLELARQQRQRDEDLGVAAMAAVEAIIGAAGVAAIGPALVQQAMAGFVDDGPVVIAAAPVLARQLRAELANDPLVEILEDPAFEPLDCELRTSRGTIRAGMKVQLAALAERWEVSA